MTHFGIIHLRNRPTYPFLSKLHAVCKWFINLAWNKSFDRNFHILEGTLQRGSVILSFTCNLIPRSFYIYHHRCVSPSWQLAIQVYLAENLHAVLLSVRRHYKTFTFCNWFLFSKAWIISSFLSLVVLLECCLHRSS